MVVVSTQKEDTSVSASQDMSHPQLVPSVQIIGEAFAISVLYVEGVRVGGGAR
jgi:hypothetical protein